MRKITLILLCLLFVFTAALGLHAVDKLKVGFIYVGPIGDMGWTHAHDQARKIVEDTFPWVETIYQESVPEAKVEGVIDRMVRREKCDIIITTSFGFWEGTVAAAKKYPDTIFAHASGFMRAPNLATYMADFYQVYYLNGLMAGALTKSNKVGYVGAFPIPEVKRHIDAFTIGVREVNPRAEVHVRWIEAWFDPAKAKEATNSLIDIGCDVFAFTEDSDTVVQVAAQNKFPVFSHYSPMHKSAPRYVVSGQLVHWELFYLDFISKVYSGLYTSKNLENVDYWGLLKEGAAELGGKFDTPMNPAWKSRLGGTYNLVLKRLDQMKNPQVVFDPFTGPIYNRKGKIVVPDGDRADYVHLLSIEYAVKGVVGPWPGEPK
ncbi:MAG TPA: BMP family ABC transporter substrate-binding protein [Spirochaetes bacterium]|nr:BMP family ABC transporter substrate-binding protein [Spirochaetota bacterium]